MCACPCVCVCPESVAESFFDTAFTDKCVKGDTPTVRLHGAELEHPATRTPLPGATPLCLSSRRRATAAAFFYQLRTNSAKFIRFTNICPL